MMPAGWYPPGHPKHVPGLAFNGHAERNLKGKRDVDALHRSGTEVAAMDAGGRQDSDHSSAVAMNDWFNASEASLMRRMRSKSTARKAAAAHIAKIPLPLSRHVANAWYPGKPRPALAEWKRR